MESTALKRKDTTKGPPLRILSLDGGGVRGYSIFIILQEIMHRTFVEIEGRAPHRNEIPKPADHFDLIVGTGTGGLIAIMLGRLRLDIETCKELYVRLTRMVFETDKTILGIPTRSTLFKASKLEEAIREAVREHTINEGEGKDYRGTATSPLSPGTRQAAIPRRHQSNASVVSFSARSPAAQMASRPFYMSSRGDPNALLYDNREYRTKTMVTAIYRGARRGDERDEPAMLRSYDSRKEPAPEFDCRIWEAGRATCAIGLAFKPIQIGQSVFHDDGAGNFNPSPYALDEATVNEWPGREVGVFLSVGTGRRPTGSDANNPMWYDGFMGEFAEARRRLIAKIEGCEAIHHAMQREHLPKRGVNVENYYRLNVEVGVGEFGMNEWHRLADISTSTKRYLSRHRERGMVQSSAAKLAKIHRANIRYRHLADAPADTTVAADPAQLSFAKQDFTLPLAVELPGDMPDFNAPPSNNNNSSLASPRMQSPRQSYDSGIDHLSLPGNGSPSSSSADRFRPGTAPSPSRLPLPPSQPPSSAGSAVDDDHLVVTAPSPDQWRHAADARRPANSASNFTYGGHSELDGRAEPPPLPPKTPLPDGRGHSRPGSNSVNSVSGAHGSHSPNNARRPAYGVAGAPPYPPDDEEGAPPPVNKARKPGYRAR